MDKAAEFLARHPRLVALAFAALVGAAGLNAFHAGMNYSRLRAAISVQAQLASESLGG